MKNKKNKFVAGILVLLVAIATCVAISGAVDETATFYAACCSAIALVGAMAFWSVGTDRP